jgi:hypothetical protein
MHAAELSRMHYDRVILNWAKYVSNIHGGDNKAAASMAPAFS